MTSTSDSGSSDLTSFLDKVKDGTVTDTDLQNMQAQLQQYMQQSSVQNSGYTSNSGNSSDSDMKVFLDKVASGTVTSTDLTTMQQELQQASQSGSTQNSSTVADLKTFLNKVASGTVSSSDLTAMQQELQQVSQSGGAHKHHHHHGGAGNSSTSSSSSNVADLTSFLDKVANGSVSETDLQNMQSELQQWQGQSASSTGTTTASA